MKIGIPVTEFRGLASPVHGHFGSAACFVVVDTETMTCERVSNGDRDHEHGKCRPMAALAGVLPDVVLVGGIGLGALRGLRMAGIAVHRAPTEARVDQAVSLLEDGKLEELIDAAACAGHGVDDAGHCSR